mmetsp:Transcript_61891/g.191793  ORF Transcript_61891/g.191793 Transcript_61891/m.191793 type:complete len:207 (-) Transcript_61891:142-762(-)
MLDHVAARGEARTAEAGAVQLVVQDGNLARRPVAVGGQRLRCRERHEVGGQGVEACKRYESHAAGLRLGAVLADHLRHPSHLAGDVGVARATLYARADECLTPQHLVRPDVADDRPRAPRDAQERVVVIEVCDHHKGPRLRFGGQIPIQRVKRGAVARGDGPAQVLRGSLRNVLGGEPSGEAGGPEDHEVDVLRLRGARLDGRLPS